MAPDPTKPDAAALAAEARELRTWCEQRLGDSEWGYHMQQHFQRMARCFAGLAALAQRPEAAGAPVGDRDLALGLLRGLHPEITRDEPMEVALQIFDHVQAERREASRQIARMQETIDALLRQLRAAPAQARTASAQGKTE